MIAPSPIKKARLGFPYQDFVFSLVLIK